jgi:iron complex outermembrane receptor protein
MIGSRYLKRQLLGGICALVLAGTAAAQSRDFDIAAGDLKGALDAYARQAGVQLIYDADAIQGKRTSGVHGALSPENALKALLSGTGLEVQRDMSGAVAIRAAAHPKPAGGRAASTVTAGKQAEPADIQEIMVSAEKKEERLSEVPIPVTAVDTGKLTDSGQVLLKDYYNTIPGFQVTPAYEQNQMLTLRGITTGNSAIPTVGFVVDDVPFGSPIAQGNSIPDIDPGDLDRIEVLRGPQGTLYGASSMGGLVKFVTKAPSPDAFSGRVEAGTEGTKNGAEPGFQVRGSLNIPLVTDQLAVRVSGFERQDPGYIDDPSLNEKGVNEIHSSGGRLAALWKPSDWFSVNVSALYQDDKGDGVSDVTVAPGLGDLQQKFIPNTGPSDRTTQAYSVTIKADLGAVNLVSLTGYNGNHYRDRFDFSAVFGSYMTKTFGVSGAPYADDFRPNNLTEELRASGTIGESFEWLIGGFLADDRNDLRQTAYAENPVSGQIVGIGDDGVYHYRYHEYAAFTDLTYHLTDELGIQGGVRFSSVENQTGPYSVVEPIFTGNTKPVIQNVLDAKFNPVTFLVTPQYNLTQDVMLYARIASGFRPGGGNLLFPGVPTTFNPDTTDNYEIGIKGDFLERKLSIDASLYYIDWKNIQIMERTSTNHGFTGNGGEAKSEGVELSVTAHPWRGSTLTAWGDYDDAELTQAFPSTATVYGASGDRLPVSPTYSANLSARQEFPLWNDVTGFAGVAASYVGDRVGLFLASAAAARQDYPAYTKVDLSAGANTADGVSVNLYATNVTDKRGVLEGGTGSSIPTSFYYIRPRTVGLSVAKTF